MNAFEALGLNEQLVQAITEMGFETKEMGAFGSQYTQRTVKSQLVKHTVEHG